MDLTLKSASMLHFLHHTVFNRRVKIILFSLWIVNERYFLEAVSQRLGGNCGMWMGIPDKELMWVGGKLVWNRPFTMGTCEPKDFHWNNFFSQMDQPLIGGNFSGFNTIIRHLLLYFIKFYYLMAFISFELIQLVWFSCWEQSNVVTIWLCHKMWFIRVDLQASACKGFLKIPKLIYFYHPYVKFKWLASNFSLQYHPWMTLQGHKNKGNDHQLEKLLIAQQILLVSTLRNV